jgi:flagellum-specific peptidoglycan hydrolase FlgJ
MGRKYGVDPTLMMAIAEFETGHGSSYSARVRNNIAGIMDGKRHRVYRSIREGIEAQAALLKAGYISKGLTTIPQIGRKYSPTGASNDPYNTNWRGPRACKGNTTGYGPRA